MKKVSIGILVLLVLSSCIMIMVSPYGQTKGMPYKSVQHSIIVNVPLEKAYAYLGNSNNASKWSVFVHHITPLNPDSFADGQTGSRRRCFCYANEKGRYWDELISEVIPGKKRQLILYNLNDFPIKAEGLATEQLYEKLSPSSCRITFTVFFKEPAPTLITLLKTYFAAFTIHDIFIQNMNNIKQQLES